MDSYISIQFLPDIECDLSFLRNTLYTKLHKAIFGLKAKDIGISFPHAKKKFGYMMRIHSSKNRLEELQAKNWLGGLSGYCKISNILTVPDEVKGHQTLSRIRQTMTVAKLKKRVEYQKQQNILTTIDKEKGYIKQYKLKMLKTGLDNPYLELHSTSTNGKYRLYIVFGPLKKQATIGDFNHFGLSKTTTVPIF